MFKKDESSLSAFNNNASFIFEYDRKADSIRLFINIDCWDLSDNTDTSHGFDAAFRSFGFDEENSCKIKDALLSADNNEELEIEAVRHCGDELYFVTMAAVVNPGDENFVTVVVSNLAAKAYSDKKAESEKAVVSILESNAICAFTLNTRTKMMNFINNSCAFALKFGSNVLFLDAMEFYRTNLVHPEDVGIHEDMVNYVFKPMDADKVTTFENRRLVDGEYKLMQWRISKLPGEDNLLLLQEKDISALRGFEEQAKFSSRLSEDITKAVFEYRIIIKLDEMSYEKDILKPGRDNMAAFDSEGDYRLSFSKFVNDEIFSDYYVIVRDSLSPSALQNGYKQKNPLYAEFRLKKVSGCPWVSCNIFFTKRDGHPIAIVMVKNNTSEIINHQRDVNTAAVRNASDRLIETISTLVEFRDIESNQHISRIRNYTNILAHKLMKEFPSYELDERNIDLIVSAAAMHDIGKLAIPDSILLKPGKLTAEEFDIMKKHTVKGSEIIRKISDMQDPEYATFCHDIARYHHERWDGMGYPDGLVGNQIPISAQLVAVADVYDALVNQKSYKNAYSPDVTYNMIMDGECGLFNPDILHCLKLVKNEFEAASKQDAEEEKTIRSFNQSGFDFVGKRVLIVEDNEVNVRVLKNMIDRTGADVEVVYDGSRAVETVKNSDEGHFDMIIMDILLPEMDGYDAAKHIRAMKRQDVKTMPIIAISGEAFSDDIEISKESGMNILLSKPVKPRELYICMAGFLK